MPKGIYNHVMTDKRREQLQRLHNSDAHTKAVKTLKTRINNGEIVSPLKGIKCPRLAEWNIKNRTGKSSWNKGIKGKEYLKHFKDIDSWKANKILAEARKTHEQKAKPGIVSCKIQSSLKISKAELIVKENLDKNCIEYIPQWRYKFGVADFYLPKYDLVIECNGTYWHSKPDYILRDNRKYAYLKSEGHKLLILNSENICELNKFNLI